MISNNYDLTYIALGAGVQSTAMYLCSCLGLHGIPKADMAIFADTHDEPQYVYDHLGQLEAWGGAIPIHRVTKGHLGQDVIDRHNGKRKRCAAIPVFTMTDDGPGPLRRQCTSDYKIAPIEKFIKTHLGFGYRQRVTKRALCMLGISVDEIKRARPSRTKWIDNSHPLIDARMNRHDCADLCREHGFIPQKSACVFCPFHSNTEWQHMHDEHPKEFAKAVEYDKSFRSMSNSGIEQPVFLHRSLIPLDQIDWTSQKTMWDTWDDECEGHCGV